MKLFFGGLTWFENGKKAPPLRLCFKVPVTLHKKKKQKNAGWGFISGSRSNLVKTGSVRGKPDHAVIFNNDFFFFVHIDLRSYEITRGTGSVPEEPVQYGEPVHAVLVHI